MKVALHDADATRFPNLALMKLSAWHKARGDDVSWFLPAWAQTYDRVYSSKVFTFTEDSPYLPPGTIKGGTGYGLNTWLDDNIEHIMPDYSLYELDYSLGFTTRGCPNNCGWCFVPEKEGDIKYTANMTEFLAHNSAVLMDNNPLSCSGGISEMEFAAVNGIKVDYNQGLDARLIDDGIARLLAKMRWLKPIRMACDTIGQVEPIWKATALLRKYGATPKNYFCYVLVKDIPDALERVMFLRELGIDPFAQAYRDREGSPPTREQKRFERWVNHKAIFKTVKWEDYK